MSEVNPTGGRILVGVDGSEGSKEALRWAAEQARYTGARLDVVMAWKIPGASYGVLAPMPTSMDLPGEAKMALDKLIEEVLGTAPAVTVSARVVEGPPAAVLLKEAEGADLLVVGNRGHGGLVGMLLGSVSEQCVAHARCPVIVAHPRAAA